MTMLARTTIARATGAMVATAVVSGLGMTGAAAAPRAVDDSCPAGLITSAEFADVSGSFAASIDCAWHWGLANGTSSTRFSPAGVVTRGQMAAFISRLVVRGGAELPADPANAFSDDDGSNFELEISQLAEAGIVNGTGARRYSPNAAVTRGQMAAFLTRAYDVIADQAGYGPLPEPTVDAFSDDNGSPLRQAIDKAAAAGLAGGNVDGTYRPAAPVRRDQMTAFLVRVLDLVVQQGRVRPGEVRDTFGLGSTLRLGGMETVMTVSIGVPPSADSEGYTEGDTVLVVEVEATNATREVQYPYLFALPQVEGAELEEIYDEQSLNGEEDPSEAPIAPGQVQRSRYAYAVPASDVDGALLVQVVSVGDIIDEEDFSFGGAIFTGRLPQ